MTASEREDARRLFETATVQRRATRAGCALIPPLILALFPLGMAVVSPGASTIGIIVLLGLGLWLITPAKDAVRAAKHGQIELEAGIVERFAKGEATWDVVPASGRVLDGEAPRRGTIRVVGEPPLLIGEGGKRRLSLSEIAEIERLVAITRRRIGIAEILASLWLLPLGMVLCLMLSERGWFVLVFLIPASLPSLIVLGDRIRLIRLRNGLRKALLAPSWVEIEDDPEIDGPPARKLGLLTPSGILWTIDGEPSPFRTHWQP